MALPAVAAAAQGDRVFNTMFGINNTLLYEVTKKSNMINVLNQKYKNAEISDHYALKRHP